MTVDKVLRSSAKLQAERASQQPNGWPKSTGRPFDRPAEPLTDKSFRTKVNWLHRTITLVWWSEHWTMELFYGLAVERRARLRGPVPFQLANLEQVSN